MSNELDTTINPEARARIIATAEQLYEAAGRGANFPNVSDVRRNARADMNTTSAVMKEWRRSKSTAVVAVAVAVPDRLRLAFDAALASVWTEAQDIANEALSAAQAAWETERAEAESLRAELSQAFESQGAELAAAQERITELDAANGKLSAEVSTLRDVLAKSEEQAHMAQARAEEIERRADELRIELDRAHGEADAIRASLAEQTAALRVAQDAVTVAEAEKRSALEAGAEERTRLADELAAVRADAATAHKEAASLRAAVEAGKAESERNQAQAAEERTRFTNELAAVRADAATAREDAARKGGELDALRAQSVALLDALKKPADDSAPADASAKPARKSSAQDKK